MKDEFGGVILEEPQQQRDEFGGLVVADSAPTEAQPEERTGALGRLGRGIVNIPYKGAVATGKSAIQIFSQNPSSAQWTIDEWESFMEKSHLKVDEPKGQPIGFWENAADIAGGVGTGVAQFVATSPVGGGAAGLATKAPGIAGRVAASPIGRRVIADTATGAVVGAGEGDAGKMGAITGLAGAASFLPGGRILQTIVQGAIPMAAEAVTGKDPLSKESLVNAGVQAVFGALHGGAKKPAAVAEPIKQIVESAPEVLAPEAQPAEKAAMGKITQLISDRQKVTDEATRSNLFQEGRKLQDEADAVAKSLIAAEEALAPPSEKPFDLFPLEKPNENAPTPQQQGASAVQEGQTVPSTTETRSAPKGPVRGEVDQLSGLLDLLKKAPEEPPAQTTESTAPAEPAARPQAVESAASLPEPKPLTLADKAKKEALDASIAQMESELRDAQKSGDQEGVDSMSRILPNLKKAREAYEGRPDPVAEKPPDSIPTEREQSPTGIRNAVVDQERAARGLPPRMEPLRKSFGQSWDEAMVRMDKDPETGKKLVNELQENPRAITDVEDAILTHEQVTRQAAFDKAVDDVNSFPDNEQAARALDQARNDVQAVYDAGQAAGTETGRGLAARKLMVNEDYSLARMEATTRAVANKGEPLTASQAAEVKALHDRIAESEKQLAEFKAKEAQGEAQRTLDNLIRETRKGAREAKKTGSVQEFLDKQAEAARKRIRERRGKLNVTLDPLNIAGLADEAIIGASHLSRGLTKLADWSAKMLEEFGERIRPYLEPLFKESQKIHGEKAGPSPLEKAQTAAREGKRIAPQDLFNLAREKVNQGIVELDPLMEALRKDLDPIFPGIDRAEIETVFSDYGKVTYPSKAADLTKLRELKALARLSRATADAIARQAPKKTGPQRDKPTQAVRDAMKRLKAAMDEAGIETRSPEEQLASTNAARKTALENQIEDLDRQLQTGVKTPKSGKSVPDSPDVERLRSLRDALKEQVKEIENAAKPPVDENAVWLKNAKAALDRRTAELQRRVREGDYSKPVKKERTTDSEYLAKALENQKAKEDYAKMLFEAKLANRTPVQKVLGAVKEAQNLQRALVTSVDFSAALNQGGFIAAGNPWRAAKIVPSMIKSFFSQKEAFRVSEEIKNRANYPKYKQAKLFLADQEGHTISKMEEVYMSRWGEKIPIGGKLIKGSERAYTTFLNKLRADSFDALEAGLTKTGKATPEEAKALANYINVATGRGSASLDRIGTWPSMVFFSPRYVASRFQLLGGQPLYGGSARTRALIAKEYAKFLLGTAVFIGLATAAQDKKDKPLVLDPRSSDFGKVRFGQTRVDPWTGLAQNVTMLSRFATGKTVPANETKAKKIRFGDVALSFLRNKLAPFPASGWDTRDILVGEKPPIGHPTTLGGVAASAVTPISMRDIYDVMREQGVPRGTALTLLGIFGMRIQQHDAKDRK